MATVQSIFYRLLQRIDPITKKQQKIHDASAAIQIASVENTTPVVVHLTPSVGPLRTGDQVFIAGSSVSAINNGPSNPHWTITRIDGQKISLDGSVASGTGGATGTVVPALVGSVDGDKFTRERQIAIYNEARMALLQALSVIYAEHQAELTKRVGALVVNNENFSFTQTANISTATKPQGYVAFVSLHNTNGIPLILLGAEKIQVVRGGLNRHYAQSSTNIFVFDIGSQFVHYGTYVPTGSNYKLTYIGLTDWTLADVTGGTAIETFNTSYLPILIDLGVALAHGQGHAEVITLAHKLLGGRS